MSHRDDAAALLAALDIICDAIPGFGMGAKQELGALVRHASVSNEAILTTAGMVDDRPQIAKAANLDRKDAYDAVEFSVEYGMVAEKLERMASGVRAAIIRRRAPVGRAVLIAIAVAKRLKYDITASRKALAKKQRKFPAKRRRKKA
jgi:hypothetical protein